MDELPIKNQWCVLSPHNSLDTEHLKEAKEFGFNALLMDQEMDDSPLFQVIKIESERVSPFELDLMEKARSIRHRSAIYWKSYLKAQDFKEELLKRSLLPLELYLLEIMAIRKAWPKSPLFYELPGEMVPIERLLNLTPPEVYFLFSHVKGDPKRLDLSSHPWLKISHPRLIPIYEAEPLKGEVEWPYIFTPQIHSSFMVYTPCWKGRPRLKQQLRTFCGKHYSEYPSFDENLSLLQAIVDGEATLKPEEMRLLFDYCMAKMRWEAYKDSSYAPHDLLKKLLIDAFQTLRLNVPSQLSI